MRIEQPKRRCFRTFLCRCGTGSCDPSQQTLGVMSYMTGLCSGNYWLLTILLLCKATGPKSWCESDIYFLFVSGYRIRDAQNFILNKKNEQLYCIMLGVSDQFCPPIVQVTPLKTPFGFLTLLFQSQSHTITAYTVTRYTFDYPLLTVDYFCWRWSIDSCRWPVDCWLSCFWLALLWLRLIAVFDLLQLPSHCLKKGLAGPKWEHLPLLFIYAL
jgi:hypothetical protein